MKIDCFHTVEFGIHEEDNRKIAIKRYDNESKMHKFQNGKHKTFFVRI
jgi:hypothetical protein